eukprot:scaffold101524_cov37-Prasinocladus_malaysianus.AAC.1
MILLLYYLQRVPCRPAADAWLNLSRKYSYSYLCIVWLMLSPSRPSLQERRVRHDTQHGAGGRSQSFGHRSVSMSPRHADTFAKEAFQTFSATA